MSSSRTATPLAHAAHSGDTRWSEGAPQTAAPGVAGWRSAWRAARTGRRASDAAATAASSITRLITISVTSAGTSTGSVATAASFHASCSSRAREADDGYECTSCSIISLSSC